METFSALLAICAGNSPVHGEFPAQRPVTRSFDVFFDVRPNKQLSKQSWGWWSETLSPSLWRHRNVTNRHNECSMIMSTVCCVVLCCGYILTPWWFSMIFAPIHQDWFIGVGTIIILALLICGATLGLFSLRRRRLTGTGIPIVNTRRSDDRLQGNPYTNKTVNKCCRFISKMSLCPSCYNLENREMNSIQMPTSTSLVA